MRGCPFNVRSIVLIWLLAAGLTEAQSDVRSDGAVLVSLGPPEATALGAAWKIDDGPFRPSGFSETQLSPGRHLLQFARIPGWVEPGEQELLIVGGSTRAVELEYASLPAFYFRMIPFQTALEGTPLRFVVASSDPSDPESPAPGTRLQMSASPQPRGAITFDPASGELRYEVDPEDRRDFTVTFTGGGLQGTVVITPAPSLPPEEAALHFERPLPDPASRDYLQIRELKSAATESFNLRNVQTRSISISGRLLLFEAGSTRSDLYTRYEGDEDIKDLTLYAETVIVRSPLHLPQTRVEVHARELRFEGNGTIDVTPKSYDFKPDPLNPLDGGDASLPHGRDGGAGLAGPTMDLQIESFHSDPGLTRRLILRGAGAQDAGEGRPGRDQLQPGTQTCGEFNGKTIIYSVCTQLDGTPSDECGSQQVFGENGVPAGTPGVGGAGGTLQSSLNLAAFADLAGGVSGRKGADQPGAQPTGTFVIETFTSINGEPCVHVRHTTVGAGPGSGVVSPGPAAATGPDGSSVLTTDAGAWLHPLAVRSSLLFAKDAYLDENLAEARAILDDYRVLIETLKSGLTAGDEKDEFDQIADELETLLHRIDSNLDYFGNPVTWVPLLSFEANLAAFTNEVDRAIPTLYLAHWVEAAASKATSTRDAAVAAKGRIEDELDSLLVDHAIAQQELPVLTSEATALDTKLTAFIAKLAALQAQLDQRARDNVEERHKVPFWRKAVGVLGAVAKVIPYGQPALGFVGAGLSLLGKFDPDHPLANLDKIPDLLKAVKGTNYTACVKQKADEAQGKDPKKEPKQTLLDRLKGCAELLKTGIKDIREVLKETQADDAEVKAEVEKLRAADPVFEGTTKEIEKLNAEKKQLSDRITATIEKLTKFTSAVEENELAIDQLDRDLSAALDVLDHRSVVYVADMAKRTMDRLLYYQYLMAKAYQYRTLKHYTGSFQLGRVLDRVRTLIESQNSTHLLSGAEFDSLKAIYVEELGRIADDILTNLNVDAPERSAPVSFRLTQQELAVLNEQGSLEIDLAQKGLFGTNEEDLRIVSIETEEPRHVRTVGTIGTTATLRLKLEHSGISPISKGGETFLFTHYRTERVNPIIWSTVYNAINGSWAETAISAATESLLRSLLGLSGTGDIVLYSRPGALAKLVLTKEVTADAGVDLVVEELTLKVQYDFAQANSGLRRLDVSVSDDLTPRILLDGVDSNGRRDGRGEFHRTFAGPGMVRLEAPPTHGMWTFDHWEVDGSFSAGHGADDGASPTVIDVPLTSNRTARAVYRSEAPADESFRRADSNGDGALNITDAVSTLNFLFTGGIEPACKDAADANDDGGLDITDAVFTLGFLFLGGVSPPAPGPSNCGADPSVDSLGPCSYAACR